MPFEIEVEVIPSSKDLLLASYEQGSQTHVGL